MAHIAWDDYRLFAAVARSGNITKAARELRISAPTISRRIKRLEEEVGAKLFTHDARGAHLTPEGDRVLNHASAAEFSLGQAASAPSVEHTASICRIMVGDGLATYWLPQFLPAFLEKHSYIDLALFAAPDRLSPKPSLFDLQIQYVDARQDDPICVRLATMHFTLFASRAYVRAHGKPATVSDLASHRVLDLAFDAGQKGNLAMWAKFSGRTALLTGLNGALCESVRYGAGIALLPSFAPLLDRNTVPVLPEFSLQLPLFLSFDRDSSKRPGVQTVIDYLREVVFDPNAMPWFADAYSSPHPSWHKSYQAALDNAGKVPTPPSKHMRAPKLKR